MGRPKSDEAGSRHFGRTTRARTSVGARERGVLSTRSERLRAPFSSLNSLESMKTVLLAAALCVGAMCAFRGQTAESESPSAETDAAGALRSTTYQVGERGPHHRVWHKVVCVQDESGLPVFSTNRAFIELGSGLHVQRNGILVEAHEEIAILPEGGAAATNGQHQVYFPTDLYAGAVQLFTPDGKVLIFRPTLLSFFDGSNSVLLAELTNSTGYVSGNQATYPGAFSEIADVRYRYTKAGFEQDIIVRRQLPPPEDWGLNAATTRLQVFTEFFSIAEPARVVTQLPSQGGMALEDESLDFGVMKIGPGRAFLVGTDPVMGGASLAKQWAELERRQFLIEEVPVAALADAIQALPPLAGVGAGTRTRSLASRGLALPAWRPLKESRGVLMGQARGEVTRAGLVLDFETLNSSQTNYTFRGDTTYYISSGFNSLGTNTFEAGTVIKFATNAYLSIIPQWFTPKLDFRSTPWNPAVFTAKDDDSVGESITNSTGDPTNHF
jgi:hypothetical protein